MKTSEALVLVILSLNTAGCGVAEGLLASYGVTANRVSPATLDKMLAPHDIWFIPEPHTELNPGVLLLPGCAGTQPFHKTWGEFFAHNGFAGLLIDSFKARSFVNDKELEAVCEGEHTWGFERAADVLVSLNRLRDHPQIDAERLYIVGWSHGGWAAMDAALLGRLENRLPLLSEPLDETLKGVRAVVAFYPYCGIGSMVRRYDWQLNISGLIILATFDQNIEAEGCRNVIQSQQPDTNLRLLELPVDHWFDNPDGHNVVPHRYDEPARNRAAEAMLRLFAQKQKPPAPNSEAPFG